MNQLQKKALDYLTQDGHPERRLALEDLIGRGLFSPSHPERDTRRVLQDYVYQNPRGFCPSGIDRFKAALLGRPTVKFKVTFEVEVEYDAATGYIPSAYHTGSVLAGMLSGTEFLDRKVLKATATDLEVL